MATVAVVGVGAMGSRIALRLLDAGYQVLIWNRSAVTPSTARQKRSIACAHAACGSGAKITGQAARRRLCPVHGNPRIAAGEPVTNDYLKCQLTPVHRADYPRMTNAQFAQLKSDLSGPACAATASHPPALLLAGASKLARHISALLRVITAEGLRPAL